MQPLKRVPVCSPQGVRYGPIEFIDVEEVLYYYTKNAVRRGLISGHEVGTYPYRSGVYFRTARGVYRSTFRSLRTVLERISAEHALKANHGIVVNPDRVAKLEPWAKKKEAIFHVENRTPHGDDDWIWLSRQGLRTLRMRLGV
jgi:hypothetical protein